MTRARLRWVEQGLPPLLLLLLLGWIKAVAAAAAGFLAIVGDVDGGRGLETIHCILLKWQG